MLRALTIAAVVVSTPAFAGEKLYHEHQGTAPQVAIPSLAPLIKQIKPAVVNIATKQRLRRNPMRDPMEEYFGQLFGRMPMQRQPIERESLGSGFIIDEKGYVLTNNHVIDGADQIHVHMADGREFPATVVGADPKTDVALIKVQSNETNFPFVALGDSDQLQIGDWVVAIGNPFGLELSVTHGLVSAKERTIGAGPYDDFIQSDALINPGNSGGPLFSLNGDVVGINTAITSTGQGIGFAVPINVAKNLLPQLETGKIVRGWLGVSVQVLNPNLAQALSTTKGAIVAGMVHGGPAQKAGLRNGDVIVALNGHSVATPNELTREVAALSPGTKADVDVVRDGKTKSLKVKIGQRPEDDQLAAERMDGADDEAPARAQPTGPDVLGLAVAPMNNPRQAEAMGLNPGEGVVVVQVKDDGPAASAGVERGDVVVEVNRRTVHSPAEYEQALKGVKAGDMALLRLQRQTASIYVAVKI